MTRNLLTGGHEHPELRAQSNRETRYREPMHPDDQNPSSVRKGIAGRVEAASKMSAPGPKGKGLVMMLIGIAVLGALIWDFTGRSASSRRVKEALESRGEVVTAPDKGGAAPSADTRGLELTVEQDGTELTLNASAAVAFIVSAQGKEDYAGLCDKLLRALAAKEGLSGRSGREAFELASRVLDGADDAGAGAIDDLTIKAHAALGDDAVAPAAILFLQRLPAGIDRLSARALDKVILDRERPLHVRIAAARARPADDRPEDVSALADDPNTHPALREALR